MTAATGPRVRAVLAEPESPVGRPAWWLREAMATGALRVRDVVEAHLHRLDEVQPWLNATVAVVRDRALAEADHLQDRIDAGEATGVLTGVPFTVKDVIATAGVTTCCGSAAMAGNIPAVDATAVRRLRQAGAILIAKTNCPEFGFGVTTGNITYGDTRSPWGDASPGGSSGGEAALVSAGATALGLGTDYGGSLRWPAQSCGVLALRPELGDVDGTGQLPEPGGRLDGSAGAAGVVSVQGQFQVVGPLARNVRDLALAYAVLSEKDPTGLAASGEPSGSMRIGWTADDPQCHIGTDVQAVIRAVVDALAGRGFELAHRPGVLDGLHETFNALRATDPLTDVRTAIAGREHRVGPVAQQMLRGATGGDVGTGWDRLQALRERTLRQLQDTPVLIVPVAPASVCDLDGNGEVDGAIVTGFALMAQCRAITALGLPALSIPVGCDRAGLPVSVQVVAGPGRTDLVLQVAALLEELLGGHRTPPWLPR